MAISKIKKINIFVHKDELNPILTYLQKQEIIQLEKSKVNVDEEFSINTNTKDINLSISKIKRAISFLEKHNTLSFKEKFLYPKISLEEDQITDDLACECEDISSKVIKLEEYLDKLEEDKKYLEEVSQNIKPWLNVDRDLDELFGTKWTRSLAGIVNKKKFVELSSEFKNREAIVMPVSITASDVNFAVICFYDIMDDVQKEISKVGTLIHWQEVGSTPKEIYNNTRRKIQIINRKIEKAHKRAEKIADILPKLKIIYDKLFNEWVKEDSKQLTIASKKTYLITGWVSKNDIKKLEEDIKKEFKTPMLIFKDPEPGEIVPVIFQNKKPVRPFEVITQLYGYPSYSKSDPTPFLAPFFFIFFGLCLADAGYGIIMMVFAFFAILLFKKRKEITQIKFFKLLIFLGLASFLVGVITGGWLGNLLDKLPNNMTFLKNITDKLIVFNPLDSKGSILFLAGSLFLGFIQIWIGVLLRLISNIKEKNVTSLIFEDFPTLGIQTSLLPLALYYVLNVKFLPQMVVYIFIIVLLVSMTLISWNQWKSNEGIFIKLFWCVYGNYAIITGNFLADTLSYARLFALGLSGALLALAVNEISMVFLSVPYIGIGLMVLVLIVGHLFTIAISFLGAFVHTCRLQYLEFFTKFFEGGGTEFKPFKEERIYTVNVK